MIKELENMQINKKDKKEQVIIFLPYDGKVKIIHGMENKEKDQIVQDGSSIVILGSIKIFITV